MLCVAPPAVRKGLRTAIWLCTKTRVVGVARTVTAELMMRLWKKYVPDARFSVAPELSVIDRYEPGGGLNVPLIAMLLPVGGGNAGSVGNGGSVTVVNCVIVPLTVASESRVTAPADTTSPAAIDRCWRFTGPTLTTPALRASLP